MALILHSKYVYVSYALLFYDWRGGEGAFDQIKYAEVWNKNYSLPLLMYTKSSILYPPYARIRSTQLGLYLKETGDQQLG